MLFFKLRPKPADIIPPPSPTDFEEELKEKPKFFDELIKKPKSETFIEEEEFNRLINKLNEGEKPLAKKEENISKKKTVIKKQKLSKKEIKKSKIIMKKRIQSKRLIKARPIKQAKKQKASLPENDLDFENLDFKLPKELEQPEVQFPETLDDFDAEREFKQKTKPKEILDAEEEIQNAIEKIKKWNAGEQWNGERVDTSSPRISRETRPQLPEKPSILKRLFSRKREEAPEERLMLEPQGNIFIIQSKINDARQALMRFDLETAKRSYIEVLRLYNNMTSEEKVKVYHDIKELYSERKSAEELKV